jgi:hypothetical protein
MLLDVARNTQVAAENIIIEHAMFVCPIIIRELRVPDRVATCIQFRHRFRTTLLRPPPVGVLAKKMVVLVFVDNERNLGRAFGADLLEL